MTGDGDRLAALRRDIRTDPASVAVESLLPRSDADAAELHDLRDLLQELARAHPQPDTLVQSVLDGVVEHESANRRHLLTFLLRAVRVRPQPVAPTLCDGLADDRPAVRLAAAEVLAFTVADCWGLYRPAIPALLALLSDDDPRMRAAAAATLASLARPYPNAVVPGVSDAIAMLDQPVVSTEGFAFKAHQPAGRALELLAALARPRPKAVRAGVPLATTLLREDDMFVEPAVTFLRAIARSRPDALEPMPWLLERAADLDGECRVAVLDLARFVGVFDNPDDPVEQGERVSRDVQGTQADRKYLESLDDDPLSSSDVERVLSLLRAADVNVRRQAARALFEPRTSEDAAAIHAHAGDFLALVDEPDDSTRTTLIAVLRPVVAQYAPDWLPALLDIARTGSPAERRFVASLLSVAAGTYPSGVRGHLGAVLELADRASETTVSITTGWTLFHVATAHPDVIRPASDTVLDLGGNSRGVAAKTIVECLSAYPEDVDVFAPTLRQACQEVAAELDDPATEGIVDPAISPFDPDAFATPAGLCRILKAICLIASLQPAAVEPVRSALAHIVAYDPGVNDELDRARMLATSTLAELDRTPSSDQN
ncbi:HEAT repeat domain-containing protein [Natrinema altunense]|uniref:HEAT repeat domain-containing protein n=1 Tax=Natrinema altunense TaxID=222984 RepID=A0A482XXE6_9EURY|nr:HEAT repeat domain-containing protein [Natrinema altunense]RZH67822.1 hypothetical protein ELS17_09815 [Natrinema altunense]